MYANIVTTVSSAHKIFKTYVPGSILCFRVNILSLKVASKAVFTLTKRHFKMPVIALMGILALAPWSVQPHVAKRSKKNVDIVTIVFIMSLKLLFYWLSEISKMPMIATVAALTLVPWPVLQHMELILYFIMLSKYLWQV
jgi:hypothetical protein